ncbi:uncharacterized protein LOC113351280 [Papaver somniferum]|uniref:uncharacterized protein LOC113351280 n=1 Tax=Papaver somniferum TaxID=3469 RepID=UPI000E7005B0|nr:uncharacterized protein LOC113351280 [Papaver somniferum]
MVNNNDSESNTALPHDLIMDDILTGGPIESVVRFTCVCKLWSKYLLNDKRFALLHQKNSSYSSSPGIIGAKLDKSSCKYHLSLYDVDKNQRKIWNKEVFGHTNTRLNAILSDIQTLDGLAEDNILNEEERIMQLQNKVEFEKISKMEETAWKIKSNTKWLQEGDRNTSFFISNASARRRYNRIRQLYIGDELVSDRGRLQDPIVEYYKTLFTEEEVIRPDLEGIEFDSITSLEASILEANFTEEEVLHAISDLANDKAAGPDGFPILFFQKCWRFIKEDIMSTVNEFCTTGTINSKHNSTFITLVPKKDHIETINDCRPICLLTSVYKIIAKVLATRLKLVMDKLISPVQCAYIEGRQIIDDTLIANELVDSRLKSGKPGIVCKIDLEKAFDRINWIYVEFVLQQMSFSKKWCDWLRFCYSTSSFSVLINGSSFGYFTSTRDVRQDDTIFFVDNNKDELLNLFSALHFFEFIAGLKVNTSKTRLIGVGDVPDLAIWEEEFGCSTDCLPFMYLGMPLGTKSGSKVIWDPIFEKFDARLFVWIRISLSRGGKLALLKCILSSLPTYYFSLFKAPASVIKILEKKMCNFLWECKDGAKTSHLVNWDMVRATKERGGLGVCNLKLMNQALLAKWCWRYGVEKNKLWYKIIVHKYGDDFSFWNTGKITQSYVVSCWRSIAEMEGLIYDNYTLYLHSGRGIYFWNDVWCGQLPLATVYPNLYKLSRDRNVKLADMVSSNGNWKFDFKRVLHSLEVEDYAALLTVIGDNPPARDGLPDTRRWRLNTTGVFTVKSLYAKLVSEFGVDNFPYHFIWKSAIPPKINILMWSLIHGKLNTIDVLLHKGLNLYNSCALCGIGAESQDHLFLHCKIAYKIWFSLIPKTGWVWVLAGSMNILADMWHHHLFSSSGNYIWDLIPAAIVSTIWRERNCRRFETQYLYKTDDDLVNEVKSAVLAWVAATGHHDNFCKILTLGEFGRESWRNLVKPGFRFDKPYNSKRSGVVFSNGVLYWLRGGTEELKKAIYNVYFSTETFHATKLPNDESFCKNTDDKCEWVRQRNIELGRSFQNAVKKLTFWDLQYDCVIIEIVTNPKLKIIFQLVGLREAEGEDVSISYEYYSCDVELDKIEYYDSKVEDGKGEWHVNNIAYI